VLALEPVTMARVVPTPSRVRIIRDARRLRMTVRVPRNWFVVLLAAIQNLRPDATSADPFRSLRGFPTGRLGALAFDYGARTQRLGLSLEGQDVQTVLEAIRERLPTEAQTTW